MKIIVVKSTKNGGRMVLLQEDDKLSERQQHVVIEVWAEIGNLSHPQLRGIIVLSENLLRV